MRTLSGAALAALADGTGALITLLRIDFLSGVVVALNSSNWDFDYLGVTYRGAYGLGAISPITDTPSEVPGVQLELQNVDSANLALALDPNDQVQGSPVNIFTAIVDKTTYQIVEVELDWSGRADVMSTVDDGEKATITLSAESKAVDLLRGQRLTYTDADQKTQYSADRAFEYVVDQADKPVIWPTREWYFK